MRPFHTSVGGLVVLMVMVIGGLFAGSAAADNPRQTEHSFEAKQRDGKKVTIKFLLYLPEGYEKGRERYPLVLFLHGAGERGDDLNMVKRHGPPMQVDHGKEFPFILVSPQCPTDKWWDTDTLNALLDFVCSQLRVDVNREYVTGLSMGGFGTWAMGCKYPKRFAAIMPICGGGDPNQARALKNMPIWAFHGEADPTVNVEKSKEMVNAVNAAGGHAKLTTYPGVGHNSWTQTYNNDEVYTWLLSQKRGGR